MNKKKIVVLFLVLTCACAHFDAFGTFIGAGVVGIGVATVHELKHPKHPACTISRGPDTVVTRPTPTRELKGERWGNECLTWEEVRKLRHEGW